VRDATRGASSTDLSKPVEGVAAHADYPLAYADRDGGDGECAAGYRIGWWDSFSYEG
jgi:hypothetical protein